MSTPVDVPLRKQVQWITRDLGRIATMRHRLGDMRFQLLVDLPGQTIRANDVDETREFWLIVGDLQRSLVRPLAG